MKHELFKDVTRQTLNVVGAVAQVGAGAVVGPGVGLVANEHRSSILPAGYAFTIWSFIFLLFAAYAAYQALPSRRTDPLLRSIGPWTAGATIGNGIWTLLFPNRLFVPAQLMIVTITVCAVVALLRYQTATVRHEASGFERWIIGLAVGLLAGWITAASFVGFAGTLVTLGWGASGDGAAAGGSGLLLFAGGVAVAVLLAAGNGELVAWLAYAGAVVWALVAVAANNAAGSGFVAAVALAVAAAVMVLVALLLRANSGRQPLAGAGA